MPPSPERPNAAKVVLVLGLGVCAIAFGALFYRLAEDASGAPEHFGLLAASWRMAIAGLLLAPAGLRATRRERPPRHVLVLACASGLALAVHFATWISSLQYTTVAASTALVNTNPVWVALLAWLVLKERPRPRVLVGAAIAIAGGGFIAIADAGGDGRGVANPLLGDGLAVIGAVAASIYYLLGRAVQRAGLSLTAYAGVAYAVAGLALLPTPAIAGIPYFDIPAAAGVYLVLLAVIPQLVGHTSVNWSVKHVDPALVAVVLLLEPVGSALGAVALFDEVPSGATIGGIAILLIGVLVAVRGAAGPAATSDA